MPSIFLAIGPLDGLGVAFALGLLLLVVLIFFVEDRNGKGASESSSPDADSGVASENLDHDDEGFEASTPLPGGQAEFRVSETPESIQLLKGLAVVNLALAFFGAWFILRDATTAFEKGLGMGFLFQAVVGTAVLWIIANLGRDLYRGRKALEFLARSNE